MKNTVKVAISVRLFIIIIGAVLFLVTSISIVWYRAPISIKKSLTVCDNTGDSIQVELDIKYHRRLLCLDHVSGTIIWDGEVYTADTDSTSTDLFDDPLYVLESVGDAFGILFNKRLERRVGPMTIFYRDISSSSPKIRVSHFYGEGNLKNAEHFVFSFIPDNGKAKTYVGPASTVEEAVAVADLLRLHFEPAEQTE